MSADISSHPKHLRLSEEMEFGFQNDGLSVEVLTRVPAKSVLRFKCVSKGWQSIISDISFRRIQSQKSKPIVSGFFFQERFQWCDDDIESLNYVSVDSEISSIFDNILDFLPEKVVLMASSNGLLCCRSCSLHHPMIYICNPSNKEYITLEWARPDIAESVALAFDPFHHCVGVSTSFKLVSLYRIEEEMESYFSFEIYSSKTGKWRSMEEVCHCDFSLCKNRGIFANGLLHWLTDGNKILTFDVENEQSRLIDVPPSMQCKCVPEMCIGESEGCLHYIKVSEAGLQDWILQYTSESKWVLKHSISLTLMEKEYPRFLYNMTMRVTSRVTTDVKPWVDPLAFKDGLLFMTVCSKVYSYKFETRETYELCSLDSLGPNSLGSPIVLPYSMSLVPLDCPVIVL